MPSKSFDRLKIVNIQTRLLWSWFFWLLALGVSFWRPADAPYPIFVGLLMLVAFSIRKPLGRIGRLAPRALRITGLCTIAASLLLVILCSSGMPLQPLLLAHRDLISMIVAMLLIPSLTTILITDFVLLRSGKAGSAETALA
jgi:hypothetical protein